MVERESCYHAAPTTLRPIHNATPSEAQVYGDVSSKNRPI